MKPIRMVVTITLTTIMTATAALALGQDSKVPPWVQQTADHFRAVGLEPAWGDTFTQTFAGIDEPGQQLHNVAAVLRGSGEASSKEAILIVAHHHDIPAQPAEEKALLEVALRLAAMGRPQRTIVFALLSGQAWAEAGADHYIQNPAIPLEQTVYVMDLDLAREISDGRVYFLGGYSSSLAANSILGLGKGYPGVETIITRRSAVRSAYQGFSARGLPYVHIALAAQSQDGPALPAPATVSLVSSLVGELTLVLANSAEPPRRDQLELIDLTAWGTDAPSAIMKGMDL